MNQKLECFRLLGLVETLKQERRGLEGRDATRYRAIAARHNYLSIDRPDLQFAVKELCMDMAKPTEQSWSKLKRVGQYIKVNAKSFLELRVGR